VFQINQFGRKRPDDRWTVLNKKYTGMERRTVTGWELRRSTLTRQFAQDRIELFMLLRMTIFSSGGGKYRSAVSTARGRGPNK
jgi:hypothetical protein